MVLVNVVKCPVYTQHFRFKLWGLLHEYKNKPDKNFFYEQAFALCLMFKLVFMRSNIKGQKQYINAG